MHPTEQCSETLPSTGRLTATIPTRASPASSRPFSHTVLQSLLAAVSRSWSAPAAPQHASPPPPSASLLPPQCQGHQLRSCSPATWAATRTAAVVNGITPCVLPWPQTQPPITPWPAPSCPSTTSPTGTREPPPGLFPPPSPCPASLWQGAGPHTHRHQRHHALTPRRQHTAEHGPAAPHILRLRAGCPQGAPWGSRCPSCPATGPSAAPVTSSPPAPARLPGPYLRQCAGAFLLLWLRCRRWARLGSARLPRGELQRGPQQPHKPGQAGGSSSSASQSTGQLLAWLRAARGLGQTPPRQAAALPSDPQLLSPPLGPASRGSCVQPHDPERSAMDAARRGSAPASRSAGGLAVHVKWGEGKLTYGSGTGSCGSWKPYPLL